MTIYHSKVQWKTDLLRIEACFTEIREWMGYNKLKLNDDKTELIVFTSRYNKELDALFEITCY